jgi:hypothetical protein
MPEGIGAGITEFIGIGRGADSERIQDQDDGPGHYFPFAIMAQMIHAPPDPNSCIVRAPTPARIPQNIHEIQ